MTLPKTPSEREQPGAVAAMLDWSLAPDTIQLEPGQVHLWAAALHEFVSQSPKFDAFLDPAEHRRAGMFKFAKDRSQFVIRRGLLRMILSRYVGQSPVEIAFRHGKHGKPEVQWEVPGRRLFFNASHSADVAICAITSACPIGVDVEHTVDIPGIHSIARHFFVPRETQTLLALSANAQQAAFYACWTRKEAYLKATGEGIAESLAKVEVSLAPQDEPAVVSVAGNPRARKEWQLHPFVPAAGYLGCIAYRNTVLAMRQWRVAIPLV